MITDNHTGRLNKIRGVTGQGMILPADQTEVLSCMLPRRGKIKKLLQFFPVLSGGQGAGTCGQQSVFEIRGARRAVRKISLFLRNSIEIERMKMI